jgi:hypothetical protein
MIKAIDKYLIALCCLFVIGPAYPQLIFSKYEYATRREKIMDLIPDGILLMRGASIPVGNTSFCQNNDMVYLTGVEVPDVVGISSSRERSRDYDAIHYSISLTVDLKKKYLEGQNTITLSPLRDNLKRIKLDAKSLVATEVLSSNGAVLSFDQTVENIFIELDRPYVFSDTISFTGMNFSL